MPSIYMRIFFICMCFLKQHLQQPEVEIKNLFLAVYCLNYDSFVHKIVCAHWTYMFSFQCKFLVFI